MLPSSADTSSPRHRGDAGWNRARRMTQEPQDKAILSASEYGGMRWLLFSVDYGETGQMNVNGNDVLWVIGAGATVSGLVFQFAFYLGKLTQRVGSVEEKQEAQGKTIGEILHDRRQNERRT
jgi:hypothetical protein